MKKLITASLAVPIFAIQLPVETITRVTDPEICTLFTTSKTYHYEFNQAACACFIVLDDIEYDCGENEKFNPFYIPYTENDDFCISNQDYDAIFNHDLGPGCKGGQRDLYDDHDQGSENNENDGNDCLDDEQFD